MRADPEACRNALNIVDRDITFTALDSAIVSAIHLDFVREILLAETTLLPIAPDIRRHDAAEQTRMRAFHPT